VKPTTVLVLPLLAIAVNAAAQDYVNDDLQFAISLPADQGWTPPEIKTAASGALARPQQLLLVSGRSSGDRVSVQVIDVGDGVSFENLEFREGFRDGNMKSFPPTMRLVSDKVGTVAGVPAYEMIIGGTIQERPISIRMVAVVANRLQYNITGYASQAGSLTDGDVARVLSSFRFTRPPQFTRAAASERSAGEVAGRLAAYGAMAVVVVLLARLALRRKRAR
jgi:hypothetical protein